MVLAGSLLLGAGWAEDCFFGWPPTDQMHYDKRNLFELAGEKPSSTKTRKYQASFSVPRLNIALFVCYDLRFWWVDVPPASFHHDLALW